MMFREKSPLWWLDYLWWNWIGPLLLIAAVIVPVFIVLMRVKGLW